MWLARITGFGKRAAFHPPELCYVGSHYEVLERGPITVPVHGHPRRLMRLVIGQDQDRYEAWYWFTAGDRVTHSYFEQQWWLLREMMRGRPSAGMLLRLSTRQESSAAADARLLEFFNAWHN